MRAKNTSLRHCTIQLKGKKSVTQDVWKSLLSRFSQKSYRNYGKTKATIVISMPKFVYKYVKLYRSKILLYSEIDPVLKVIILSEAPDEIQTFKINDMLFIVQCSVLIVYLLMSLCK